MALRFAPLITGIVFLTTCPDSLHAQNVLYQARVKANEAVVRSGPSLDAKIYPTNGLKRGEIVQVAKEGDDGWLQILPPAGSFSWINQRYIEQASDKSANTWMVSEDNAQVFYGSSLWKEQPNIVSAKLRRGTLLTSIGRKFTRPNAEGVWLPIKPPPSEVRYIQAKDVEKDDGNTPEGTLVKATPAARGQEGEPPDPDLPPSGRELADPQSKVSPVPSQAAPAATGTIAEAQRAERLGDRDKAIKLWIEVGRDYEKKNNLALRDQCYSRADWLKQQGRTARPQNYCYTPCSQVQPRCWPGTMDGRGSAVPTSRLQPVPVQTASNVYSAPVATQPVTWNPVGSPPAVDPVRSNPAPTSNVQRGYLTSASKNVDGKQAYLLQSPAGGLICYVVGEPGVELERYVRASVDVEGVITYRTDLRSNLMRAVSIKGLQQ
jgi:SH3-like domain-containing protein